jgi:hypothetical protein
MNTQKIARILGIAVMLVAGFAALTPTFSIGVAPVSAAAGKGAMQVTKNCAAVGCVGAAARGRRGCRPAAVVVR